MGYDQQGYQDKWRIERQARVVREQLGLSQFDVLDPWHLADAVPAHVFFSKDIIADTALLRAAHNVKWDGFAFTFPTEEHLMIVLNGARPETRQCATIMEEISHHFLKHQPSSLFTDSVTGLQRRTYDRAQEREAYDLGSTILLPKELIHREVHSGKSAKSVAKERLCSASLVEYRIRRCRLWNRYLVGQESAGLSRAAGTHSD